jgi:hypothetical protein
MSVRRTSDVVAGQDLDRGIQSERGIALLVAIMTVLFMTALGGALMITTTTETKIANNFRNASEALYAADAGLERSMDDLLTIPDWNALLSGAVTSAFIDGPKGTRTLSDGSDLDLNQVVNFANCQKPTCSTSDYSAITLERPWGANNPRWQLFAYGPLANMVPTGTINSPFYVVVLVGDDPSETDDNPLMDGSTADNPGSGVLALRAEAFGPRGVHKLIEMTVARTDTTELERGYTGQRGQDEQNRRARKAPVQTPGRALTMQTLSTAGGGVF